MFEFDQYKALSASAIVKPESPIDYARGIDRRALLFWSEHCVECAAPECYQTCDLFKARPDNRCRRFESGMRRNNQLKGSAGSSAEIIFGYWGKLEARGNTVLLPSLMIKFIELTFYGLTPLVNLFGKTVRRFGGSEPWSALSFELQDMLGRRLQRQLSKPEATDGFLVEVYNPKTAVCRVKFEVSVSSSQAAKSGRDLPLPYWALLELDPGYNRRFIDYASVRPIVNSGLPYNVSLTPEAESGTHLVFITLDFVKTKSNAFKEHRVETKQIGMPRLVPGVKCVVFDLDNTLWDGVLVEGCITLRPGIENLFRALDERGILISVVSKNDADEAIAKMESLGLSQYIVYPVINWSQKSENIKFLAKKLNIATDTLLFVDDNAFEREEVASVLPEVETLADTELDNLLVHPRLAGGQTTESKSRRRMYQQQIEREEAVEAFGDDFIEFLRQCRIELELGPANESNRDRVIELLQRTNQLNFSGRKYSREKIGQLLDDDSLQKHVIRCRDKFGDYGIVGFSLTHSLGNEVTVEDFMLSCRVQGKLIEQAFFNYLVKSTINESGLLKVNFVAREKNIPARRVLEELGFELHEDQLSTLAVVPGQLALDFLEVRSVAGESDRESSKPTAYP